MATGKRHNKRTPYTGFERTHKRDAKGHFVKQDNGKNDKKKHNDGYNCYKNAKPVRMNDNQVDKDAVVVHDIARFVDTIANEIVGAFKDARNDYEKKPVYSHAQMDRAIVKTRNEVHESVRKHFRTAFWNGVMAGATAVIAVGFPVCLFWPSIVNFSKSLFN